jgi:hypothetical protein
MAKNKTKMNWLHRATLRAARLHFVFVGLFIAQTVIYDAWKLIAPNAVMNRWIASTLLLVLTTIVWYIAKNKISSIVTCKVLVWSLILADIATASFNVYTQRGMASRAVVLYVVAIVIAAVLRSRSALFATAALCVAAYTSTAIAYFVLHFNEGYKIELYGEVGFYSALFFVFAALLWAIVRTTRPGEKEPKI